MPGRIRGRTYVGILIKWLADRQTQTPQGDVVRDVWCTDRTKQDGIEFSELIGTICWHHDAVLLVVIRAPIEILKVQLELTIALSAGLKSLHTSRDNLRPDSISAHSGNPVSTHLLLLVFDERLWNVLTLCGRCAVLLFRIIRSLVIELGLSRRWRRAFRARENQRENSR